MDLESDDRFPAGPGPGGRECHSTSSIPAAWQGKQGAPLQHQARDRYNVPIMAGAVSVNVRLFALYRERLERDRLTLVVPPPATVATALAVMAEAHPRIGLLVDNTMVAVNHEYVDRAHALEDGDEVALIPPVSGGAGAVSTGSTGAS